MSETTPSHDAAAPRGDDASAEAAGAMLRQAREDAGLHVATLAAALKVPVKKLEALEAGRIDLLPDATFARGLAASICRGLKLDPKPVLDLMPGIGGSRLGAAPPAINERFEPDGASAAATLRGGRPSPAMWAVLLLLLGALAIYLWPDRFSAPADDISSGAPSATQMAMPGTVTETVVPAEPVQAAVPAAEPEPEPAASAAEAASAAPAADAAVLLFTARSESWVQVTDARGQVPLRRSLQAGERVSAGGALPLSVVIGRIDAVDVQVRGQDMDLRGIAKNNVARFEVK